MKKNYRFSTWELRSEYWGNRPECNITVRYDVYDIEWTEHGKRYLKNRYEMHKRNMEKYAKLLRD